MANLSGVVQQLQHERTRVAGELQKLDAAISALNGTKYGKRIVARGGMSAAGRARIAAAQRARWAKVKAGAKVVTMPKKRTMSASARRRIAAAQRARWAKVKAAARKKA